MADVQGTCDTRFDEVRNVLDANLTSGADLGASVCVIHEGRTVVDLWGGWSDPERTRPWQADTITNVWSTTKTMAALCTLVLADRGELDLAAPIARYWPEFAANGKGAITTAHALSHSSGLSGWGEPMQPEDLYDWDKSTAVLARMEPWWEPGTASGYHAISQGYLLGEVVRRITGRTIGRFFAEEIAGPLGADFHIGLDPAHFGRVSNVVPPPPIDFSAIGAEPHPVMLKTFGNPFASAEQSWTEGWRRAEIPAANGHGNARSVARVQAVLAHGGELDGVRLLSEAGARRPLEKQTDGVDLVLGMPVSFGLGYALNTGAVPIGPSANSYFWGGWGGSLVIIDPDQHLCITYMMNRMESGLVGDSRGADIIAATYRALGL